MSEPLTIAPQGTPNPNAVKFTINRVVTAQGTTYRDVAAADVAWAKQVLEIPGIVQVFALNNFISVTKRPDADWNQVGPHIESVLREAFA